MTDQKKHLQKEKSKVEREKNIDESSSELEKSEFEELIRKNEVLQLQLEDAEEKYKRVLADYRNLEQRTQTERIQFIQFANKNLMTALLEPLDFLHTATQHIEDKGLTMVIDRFHQVLNEQGLEEVPIKIGEKFDEATMEAVDTAEGKEDTVMEVKQKGYRMNGIVIQHARVIVGKNK